MTTPVTTTSASDHRHAPNPAPLVIRLRDLAPHLSHAFRARLALDRIVDYSNALDAARDRAAAYQALITAHGSAVPVDEFTATAVTPQAALGFAIRQPVASTVYDTNSRLRRLRRAIR